MEHACTHYQFLLYSSSLCIEDQFLSPCTFIFANMHEKIMLIILITLIKLQHSRSQKTIGKGLDIIGDSCKISVARISGIPQYYYGYKWFSLQ